MFRYLLGVLTAFLFLGSVCGLLYIFDQGGVVDLKPAVLAGLSRFPGWEEVFEAYLIGSLQLDAVEAKEQLLVEKEQLLAEKEQAVADLRQQMAEKEAEWEAEKRRYELEKKRRQQAGAAGIQGTYVQVSARLLEAMAPEAAGEVLLKMNFETGVAVLSEVDPRKAGKILDAMPPDKSAKYLDKITLPTLP